MTGVCVLLLPRFIPHLLLPGGCERVPSLGDQRPGPAAASSNGSQRSRLDAADTVGAGPEGRRHRGAGLHRHRRPIISPLRDIAADRHHHQPITGDSTLIGIPLAQWEGEG